MSELNAREPIYSLRQKLAEAQDAETALAIYKEAGEMRRQLEEIQASARALAEEDLQERGLESLETPVGHAHWQQPEEPVLDQAAWAEAVAEDPSLRSMQRDVELAYEELRQAQAPFMQPAEPIFEID
ncbi:MAG: hypothetical protein ACK2UC_01670 [Anaerolineae bacterium]|jgi:7-keto-8-aminopelargonate synthetase-like enzyme